jgi:Na+-translocating ferredoxin:NAD+ oxidoreductase RnfE subunit
MLQPYVSSRQVNGMVIGLADAARYEQRNNPTAGMARSYWDAFGVGVLLAIVLIVLGSLWSLFTGLRARRAQPREA